MITSLYINPPMDVRALIFSIISSGHHFAYVCEIWFKSAEAFQINWARCVFGKQVTHDPLYRSAPIQKIFWQTWAGIMLHISLKYRKSRRRRFRDIQLFYMLICLMTTMKTTVDDQKKKRKKTQNTKQNKNKTAAETKQGEEKNLLHAHHVCTQ